MLSCHVTGRGHTVGIDAARVPAERARVALHGRRLFLLAHQRRHATRLRHHLRRSHRSESLPLLCLVMVLDAGSHYVATTLTDSQDSCVAPHRRFPIPSTSRVVKC